MARKLKGILMLKTSYITFVDSPVRKYIIEELLVKECFPKQSIYLYRDQRKLNGLIFQEVAYQNEETFNELLPSSEN